MFKKVCGFVIALICLGFLFLNKDVLADFSHTLTKNKISFLLKPITQEGLMATNIWLPQISNNSFSDAPTIGAKSAYFIDLESGQVLYQKDPWQRLPVASLTKIMTVLLTLENKKWTDQVAVSQTAANMEPDHMELITGEKLTVEELLYGIFLVSANDAAEALAEDISGNRDDFVRLMNERAVQLQMKDSKFVNPTGLQDDNKQQYSSAYDIVLLSRYLIKHFPQVVDLSSTESKILPQTPTHQEYDLTSGINLLTTYSGVKGFKTGFTPEAGLTLVTLATRDNRWVLGVILGAEDRRGDARQLLDYCFQKLGVK